MADLRNLLRDTRGATAIEYALVASLISIAAISGYASLGSHVNSKFAFIEQAVAAHL